MDAYRNLRRMFAEVVEGYDETRSPEHVNEMVAKIRKLLEPPDESKVSDLVTKRLEPLAEQLEVETRRLIGTDESRWRKLWRA